LKKKGALYITVSAEGLLYMDQKLVNDKELKEQIEMTCKNNHGRNIIVCADKMVPFTHVVSVLDILHKAGVKNLNVAVATAR
jgi:biopolymer transport protein ExbD